MQYSLSLVRTRQLLPYLITGLVAVFFSIRQVYSPDIGFHLHAGRWILENMSFPAKDAFTHTAYPNDYIDLYWLYQVVMYSVYSIAGTSGLVAANSLLVLSAFIVLFARTGFRQAAPAGYLLLAVITVSPIFEIRPHSVSWLLLSIVLYILQRYDEGNDKIIRWMPLVMLIWVNSHSLFILGIIVIACYAVSVNLKMKARSKRFFLFAFLSLLACLLNPYGIKGLLFPWEQFLALQSGTVFKETIREVQSPFEITSYQLGTLLSDWHFFDLFVVCTVLLFALSRKKIYLYEWFIAGLFFYLACIATKNTGYFIFAVTPIAARHVVQWPYVSVKLRWPESHLTYKSAGLLIVCLLLVSSIITNAFYIHYRSIYRFGCGWSTAELPVKAITFMEENKIQGKILNHLNYGGYIEFFTRQKTSIDGRLEVMDAAIVKEQLTAAGAEEKKILLDKLHPDIVIFPYSLSPDWILFMKQEAGWRLVYVDETSALYLRNGFLKAIPGFTPDRFISSLRFFSDNETDEMIRKGKPRALFSAFFRKQYYPSGEFNLFLFCAHYGWMQEARQIMAHAFYSSTNDYPELYLNYGTLFFQQKDASRALYCYEKYLTCKDNAGVEERVRFLKTLPDDN